MMTWDEDEGQRQRARGGKRDFLLRLRRRIRMTAILVARLAGRTRLQMQEAEARRRRSRLTHASHTRSLRTCIALPMPMPGPRRTREKRWDRVRLAPDIMRAGAPPQGCPQSMNSRGRAHLSSSNAPSAISLPFCSFVGKLVRYRAPYRSQPRHTTAAWRGTAHTPCGRYACSGPRMNCDIHTRYITNPNTCSSSSPEIPPKLHQAAVFRQGRAEQAGQGRLGNHHHHHHLRHFSISSSPILMPSLIASYSARCFASLSLSCFQRHLLSP